ncbi:hypothetical protein TIFTF001_021751 [Ficus carica]|uniref:Uncharacterized protein n=1 Tax=Ficus carica TaxID=3494 RepID=A0AA88AGH8_FICCA|nr:hypothetical protein TIFTF001_021751 [Ficus carica]
MKTFLFACEGIGVAENRARRSCRSCWWRTELDGKIGVGGGRSGVVVKRREKWAKGGERKRGEVGLLMLQTQVELVQLVEGFSDYLNKVHFMWSSCCCHTRMYHGSTYNFSIQPK